jgi:catechol 2,3-dioxygenase-like lactoylglutathione lyase family enzyme
LGFLSGRGVEGLGLLPARPGKLIAVFDHVTIRAADRGASERFYETVLCTLAIEKTHAGEDFAKWGDFSLASADARHPVTRRLHIGFVAPTRLHVDEFWRTGTAAGYRDDGPPGPRPQYTEDYYGSFLLDPDGNSAEGMHYGSMRTGAVVDHLWMRVADLQASRRFYEAVAPHAGFRATLLTPDRARFSGIGGGSFSVLTGEPTEHVHMAIGVTRNESVYGFHRAATEAGYSDTGAPRERPDYHPRYYSAYVLDPDGNNVEVVNRNR